MPRRPALIAAAALAAAGLVLALLLVQEHATAHAGGTSFCSISEYVDCDRVAMSRWSVLLGLPVAAWGVLGFGLALLLALAGLSPRRSRPAWPAGLLFVVAALASAGSVALAAVSHLLIGALCILCAGSWLAWLGILAAAWRASRPAGVAEAVRSDLGLLAARPGRAAGVALAGVALLVIVASAYPRYWEGRAPPASAPPPAAAATSQGPLAVVVFSDYECPACARAHEETKALLAGRSDVRLSKRHFPLNSDCNPTMQRRMHPGACDLARVGICAEAQGKLTAIEDLLYANQVAKRPIEELARAAGLDLAALRDCVAAPSTEARLRGDIEAGLRVGLRATPTYVVGGRAYPGGLPPEVLPPRAASAAKP